MKKATKWLLLAMALCLLALPVLAASDTIQAELHYRDISIVLNGRTIEPKDANGKVVEPFIIDGTTYLPVRAISEAMGCDVDWNDATSTITLTSNGARFDYTDEIAAANFKSAAYTTPDVSSIPLSVSGTATGTVLTRSSRDGNDTELYLNTYATGNALTVSGAGIVSATRIYDGSETPLTVADDSFTFTPEAITVEEPQDEVILVSMSDGTSYSIHTLHELLPVFDITADADPSDGVYTFALDSFLVRVSTDGTVVYYRYMGHQRGATLANFQPFDLAEGRYYTYFYETNTGLRDPGNGYNSGMFVIMDEKYQEVDFLTLLPTERHGEGYLDQHEIVLLSPTHYLLLSYSREYVKNIPADVEASGRAYVQAGIVQEVRDGEVLLEIDTADYPEFYGLSMSGNDYAASTLADPATICDYVHPNGIAVDPKDNNLIVSFRNQCSVVKFDRQSGDILWILGGKGNQFSGLDAIYNDQGLPFLYQHNAMYVNATVAGKDSAISIFDNETRFDANATRTLMLHLDESTKTAEVLNVINGIDYDTVTNAKHWGTHCGNVSYQAKDSAVIGWGLHVMLDTNAETVGTKVLFSEIDPESGELLFEIVPNRNPSNASKAAFMSYRTYKNAD